MKKILPLMCFLMSMPLLSLAQFPPLELVIGTVTAGTTGTVDVPVMAGSNFQNITQLHGTFTFNPAVLTWNSMQTWGLTNPGGASFVNSSSGTVSFNWSSLITVGPTLSAGSVLFNLRFNIIGASGTSSPIGFTNSPQAMSWQNGFGWGGSNFTITNGLVSIGCVGTNPSFNIIDNFYNYSFVDASTAATSWSWDFGDGSPLVTTQNASHTYSIAGTYIVCLTSTNACASTTHCETINVCPNIPVSSYTLSPNNLTTVFTNSSTGTPATYLWDFGDGTTGTNTGTFLHTFPIAGTYNVCLTATNGCGNDTYCQPVIVTCPTPVASWTNTNNNYQYSFTSTSTGGINWLWDFGDGTTSTVPNATHTYAADGNYTVCLTVSNSCGPDSTCQVIPVSCPTPGSAFTFQSANLNATFTDATATTPTSRLWDFGDGATSALQNPTHTYSATGNYTVCLTTTNGCGSDSSCNSVVISVAGIDDLKNKVFNIYPNPTNDNVQITSSISGNFSVEFYDLQGKLINTVKAENGQKIATEGMAKGTYLVVVSNETGASTERLVID